VARRSARRGASADQGLAPSQAPARHGGASTRPERARRRSSGDRVAQRTRRAARAGRGATRQRPSDSALCDAPRRSGWRWPARPWRRPTDEACRCRRGEAEGSPERSRRGGQQPEQQSELDRRRRRPPDAARGADGAALRAGARCSVSGLGRRRQIRCDPPARQLPDAPSRVARRRGRGSAMASPETRTLIRHPLLWRPSAPAPLPPAPLSLSAAPPEVLRHVASYIDTARDLLSFSAVCTATRCAPPLGLLSTRADRVSRGFAHPRFLRQPGGPGRGAVEAADAAHLPGAAVRRAAVADAGASGFRAARLSA